MKGGPPVTLPPRPDLTRLRDLARAFQRACRAGEPRALARLAAVFPELSSASLPLSKAQTVIARELGLASWPKLKAEVDARRARRKAGKASARTPSAAVIQAKAEVEYVQMLAFAEGRDPKSILIRTPFGRAIGLIARDRIAAEPGLWASVVDVLLEGLRHPNPKVRFECAHTLDTYDDGRGPTGLAPLIDDPVPRVRWMAMHALVCDACKNTPAPRSADICRRIADHLLTDTSVKVRRHAVYEVTKCDPGLASATLTAVLERERDAYTRRAAQSALKRLADPEGRPS
jgi:hypothetical protein